MKKYLLIAIAFLGLAACQNSPEPEIIPSLEVAETEITATAAEGTYAININCNTEWTVESDNAEWLYYDPVLGDGSGVVTLQVAANEGYDPRTAQIAIRAKGITNPAIVVVNQAENKGMIAEKVNYEIGAEGGDITVNLQTNTEVTADIKVDWISAAEATRGLEARALNFTVEANEGYEPRTGTIVLSGEGVESETITVTQAETGLIAVTKEVDVVAAEGGQINIPVRSNVEFEVSIQKDIDWITMVETRAVVESTITFDVKANPTAEERNAEIYFTSPLGVDTVSVSQAKNTNINVEFANANFKTVLRKRGFDTNGDKELSVAELEAITELILWTRTTNKGYSSFQTDLINDLSDLKYLTNLEVLDIQGVPASMNAIDLSNNTKLRSFNAANTALTKIDLSANTELEELNLSATKISKIDLSNNTKLQTLHIGGCKQLTLLDVSKLTELTMLNCAYSNIVVLDVSNNTNLEALYCSGNLLAELNISTLSKLERLVCDDNELTMLDASKNTQLKSLTCTRNQLTSINVSGLTQLNRLAVSQNSMLSELSIAGNTALNFLHAAYTNLSTLDCSPAANLWMLNANNSKLTSVGIATNAALRGLRVNNNQLTTLDISKGDLRYLWADGNSTLPAIQVAETFNPTTAISFFKDAGTKWDGGVRPDYKDLSANGTANCYIISEEGQNYMFKATVKGNGYDPITGAKAEPIAPTKAYILWGHRRPAVANAAGSDNTQLNTSILRQSVELSKDGYICFTTAPAMEDGNFVIAAADDNNNILWTWHMWCVKGYDYQGTAIDVDLYNDTYKIMDRNLGAFAAPTLASSSGSEEFEYAHGLIYQWGRKDPFAAGNIQTPTAWGYMSWIDWCNPDGSLLKSPTFYIVGRSDRSAYKYDPYIVPHNLDNTAEILAHSIKNPMTYFTGKNWATSADTSNGQAEDWGKLWGNQTAEGNGVKTMYDPCPVGYTVASPDRLKFISATGSGTPVGATWQLNSTISLNNADGSAVSANPLKQLPFGLFFYTKGTRTETEHPADKTVVFLPKHNWSNSQGYEKDDKFICLYTNAPSSEEMWGGQPYKAVVTYSGYGSFKEAQWSNAAEAACGMPVRCVSE
ncbi:MAG: hypothetical protein IJ014_01855 [Rikenellaceae bacterium]|nr:hypothetical protein [Rikenellaceae bacterium]